MNKPVKRDTFGRVRKAPAKVSQDTWHVKHRFDKAGRLWVIITFPPAKVIEMKAMGVPMGAPRKKKKATR